MSNDLNKLKFIFSLEVLNGCRWSCVGCYVNKKEEHVLTDKDISNFIGLSHSLKEASYIPSILTIGPTDLFSASNASALLARDSFFTLSKSYERFTFTSTFQALNLEVIKELKKYTHLEIEFRVIIDLPLFDDDEHLNLVQKNIEKTQELLEREIVIHPQLNLFNAPNEKLKKSLTDYEKINERSYSFFGQGVDYAVSFGRSKVSKSYQRKAYELLKKTFNEKIKSGMHFDAGRLDDISENIFAFKNGSFYYAPKIYDEYVNFYDEYKVDVRNWDAKEFEEFLKNNLIKQYDQIKELPCVDCDYSATCAERGAIDFLSHVESLECIFPREAYNRINVGKRGLG